MAVVKIVNKGNLERLIAKLTLRMGRKPTQQEVLDLCVQIGSENFEKLVEKLNPVPILDDKKVKKIIASAEELQEVPWIPIEKIKWKNVDDKEIYSI